MAQGSVSPERGTPAAQIAVAPGGSSYDTEPHTDDVILSEMVTVANYVKKNFILI